MKSNGFETADRVSTDRHVLLVCPLTFSYHISICETIRAMGMAVTWWDDRPSKATWYKLVLRLFPNITKRFSEKHFLQRLDEIKHLNITHVLVIKGEGISHRISHKLRNAFPSASMGFYLWDGIDNAKAALSIIPIFDSVSTFDPVDAARNGWIYRPLFWRKISSAGHAENENKFDWCFIGTIHSDRHKVIHRLRNSQQGSQRSFVFCFVQSSLLMFVRKVLDWTMWFAPKGSLSLLPMSALDVAQVVSRSKAVLDVEHPRQRGFTMRTIETLLAGKKLVTTNRSIVDSDLYDPTRVEIISRTSPKINDAFLESDFLPFDSSVKDYYSCKGWVSELLEIQDNEKNIRSNNF